MACACLSVTSRCSIEMAGRIELFLAWKLLSADSYSRIDYCNCVLVGLPASTLAPLQRVQNAAARLILGLSRPSHITPALRQLHLFPTIFRIVFGVATTMHNIFHQRFPTYCTLSHSASVDPSVINYGHQQPGPPLSFEQELGLVDTLSQVAD